MLMEDWKRRMFRKSDASRGFSLLEIVLVLAVALVIGAMAVPNFMAVYNDVRLRSAASDLAGLMQQARILATQQNQICPVLYRVNGGIQEAYVDVNRDGAFQSTEPLLPFAQPVSAAAGAPTGTGGQPPAYVLSGDTGAGSYDNTTTLGFSPRGLPCAFTGPSTCTTPAAKYFVYYLTQQRPGAAGWAAVIVTKSGRTKTAIWNGTSWQ